MPALTTIIAGISAVGTVATVDQAQNTASRQARAQAAKKAELKEAAALEAQDVDTKKADIALGTSKASDDLLKRKRKSSTKTDSKGITVGGLNKSTAKVGGL